jgi:hypothetical protein
MLSVYKVYSLIHIDIGQPDIKFSDQIVNSFGRLKDEKFVCNWRPIHFLKCKTQKRGNIWQRKTKWFVVRLISNRRNLRSR